MNVLFVFQGVTDTPTYYGHVLSRLNELPGMCVTVVVGWRELDLVNSGVPQHRHQLNVEYMDLVESVGRGGVLHLPALSRVLWRLRPDIVVTVPEYLESFRARPALWASLRLLGVRLLLKSIPFRVPSREDYEHDLNVRIEAVLARTSGRAAALLRTLEHARSPTVRWLAGGVVRVAARGRRALAARRGRRAVSRECRHWQTPDGHLNYVEDAYRVYGSYGVPRERIHVIGNSPDTDRLLGVRDAILRGGGVEKRPRRLLHVGRLVEWKRVDLLLRALVRVRRAVPDADLLIVGEGPMEAAWRRLAQELGLDGCVQFAGGVYEAEALGRLFLSSGLYVLAGMGGISINDAMCFGLPVVCSVCDGTERALVKDGENGFLFREGDEASLAEKLTLILSDPARQVAMGQRSLDVIRNEVNIHVLLDRYAQAFAVTCSRRPLWTWCLRRTDRQSSRSRTTICG